MQPVTIIDTWAAALHASDAVAAFCLAHGFNRPTIYKGIDVEQLLDDSAYPIVVLSYRGVTTGKGEMDKVITLELVVGLYSTDPPEVIDNVITLAYFDLLEEYRRAALSAVASCSTGGYLASIDTEIVPVDGGFYLAAMDIIVVCPYAARDDQIL